jgi:hypothetical protein
LSAEPSCLYYTGAINEKSAIQMELTFAKAQVSGHYAYDSIGDGLNLKGTLAKTGAIQLQESVYNGDTQTVTGNFVGTMSADRRKIDGTWRSADGKRSLPFHLTAVAEYRTVKVERGQLQQTGTYPYFLNTSPAWKALNKQLYAHIIAAQQTFRADISEAACDDKGSPGTPQGWVQDYTLNVAFYRPDLVSLLGSDYRDGGCSHPSTDFRSVNYRITANKPQLLGLNDLFNAKTPYMDAIHDVAQAELISESVTRDNVLHDDDLSPDKMVTYTLSATGITFVFPAYAACPLFLTVDYALLKDYLNPTGPLVALAKNAAMKPRTVRDNATGLTADEAFTLGCDEFEARYAAAKKMDDNYKPSDGCWIYATLMNARNARQAAALPLAKRNQYLQVRRCLERVADTHYDTEDALSWQLPPGEFSGKNAAARENTLAAVIQVLKSSAINEQARQHANKCLATADAQARQLIIPRQTPEDPDKYTENVRSLLHALVDLSVAATFWPDEVAELAGEYAVQTTVPTTPPSLDAEKK